MSTFHTKKERQVEKEAHLNWMGGPSFDIKNPITKLRIAASSCFFGEPQYYHRDKDNKTSEKRNRFAKNVVPLSEQDLNRLRETLNAVDPREWRNLSPTQIMENTIDEALAFSPEETLKEAVRLCQEEHMRTTPQVILVRAAHHKSVKGTGLLKTFGKDIVSRADEPSVGLAYHEFRYGKDCPIPNSLKKVWRTALQSFNEYELAKYRMENKGTKTVDVMNLVHPKSDVIAKLAKGELKNTETWESIISAEGSKKETWEKVIPMCGHMALLRNLRNFAENEVSPDLYLDKLIKTAKNGKQFPFRYYSAYNALTDRHYSVYNPYVKNGKPINVPGKVLDAIEECLNISLENVPDFSGRVMSLCDNSGSARGTTTSSMGTMKMSTIGNLTGIITGMKADEGYVGIFGNKLETLSVRKKSSVFDQLKKIEKLSKNIGEDTENGIWLFWDKAIKEQQHWDSVFIYSDMQAGHGGLCGTHPNKYRDYIWGPKTDRYIDVPKLISTYRAKVNKNVMVFLVQIAGYTDTIVPEFYDKTYILGGWGDGILRFAGEMIKLNQINKPVQTNV